MKNAIWALLFTVIASTYCSPAEVDPCDVQIFVMEHKQVLFVFPCREKKDVVEILSSFAAHERPQSKKRIAAVLNEATELGFQITTLKQLYVQSEGN